MVAVWGFAYSAMPVILQTLIFSVADDTREAATSLYVLVFNVCIAVGAAVGGLATDVSGAAAALFVGAVFCLAASCTGLRLPHRRARNCGSVSGRRP
jgi:predicted MFS family arabinose efflux permease